MKTCKDTFIKRGNSGFQEIQFDFFIQKKSVYKLTLGGGGRVKPISYLPFFTVFMSCQTKKGNRVVQLPKLWGEKKKGHILFDLYSEG